MKNTSRRKSSGFTLVEIIVALGLMSILGVVASGFILPLKLTRDSSQESQSLTYARSYVEILKSRWLDSNAFENKDPSGTIYSTASYAAPIASTNATADIKLPSSSWSITTNKATWTVSEKLRKVIVSVTSPSGKVFEVTTLVSHP